MRWTAAGASSIKTRDVAIEVFAGRRAIVHARSVRRVRSCARVGIRTVDVRSDGDRITGRAVEKSRMARADRASAEPCRGKACVASRVAERQTGGESWSLHAATSAALLTITCALRNVDNELRTASPDGRTLRAPRSRAVAGLQPEPDAEVGHRPGVA
jgi:hypothetical protein